MNIRKTILALALLASLSASGAAFAKDGDIEICGYIESIDTQSVTLAGVSYPLSTHTEYEDSNDQAISREDFSVGELIELTIRDEMVHELEKEDESDCSSKNSPGDDSDDDESSSGSKDGNEESDSKSEVEFCGKITDITARSVTVSGKLFNFEPNTEFESKSGTYLTPDAFSVGDSVEVKIRNGKLHELEMDSLSGCKSSKASSGSSLSSISKTKRAIRLKSRLLHTGEVDLPGKGQVKYKSIAKNGKERDRLQMKVFIPIAAFAEQSDAASLSLLAYLQRGSETIAVCQFSYEEIENGRAEYKVDIREREGRLRVKKGTCDVDLAQPGFQEAIPSFAKGDDIVVKLKDLTNLVAGRF